MNNDLRFTDYVKSNFLQLELREILQSPPSVLMGVSPDVGFQVPEAIFVFSGPN